MTDFTDIKEFFLSARTILASIGPIDIFDIILIAVIFFAALKFISDRRAGKLFVGLVFLLFIRLVTRFFNLQALNFVLGNLFEVGILALIIIFQPELRAALEMFGSEPGKRIRQIREKHVSTVNVMIDNICTAVCQMANEKTGALIVIERTTKLGEHIDSGTIVNADVSAKMIENIFFKNSPLHDGALVIRDNRLYAAGCFLPLSTSEAFKDLGTRHHAALGVSEVSDAIVIVVSEQTGTISIAQNGQLTRGLDYAQLRADLTKALDSDAQNGKGAKNRKRRKNKSTDPETEDAPAQNEHVGEE